MAKIPKPVPESPVYEPSPIGGRIAWWMENTLIRFSKRLFNAIGNSLRSLIAFALEEFIDILEEQSKGTVNPIIDDLLSNPEIPQSIRNALNEARSGSNAANWQVQLFCYIAGIISLGQAYFSPFGRLVTYNAENEALSHRPDAVSSILMHKVGAFDENELDKSLRDIGIAPRYQDGYKILSQNWLSFGELGNAVLRNEITEERLRLLMSSRNVPDEQIDVFISLLQIIPGPQDLIRMAVREAWNDNVASTFGYDEDFPAEFATEAKKIGLEPEWAKRYWRAHWELPGVREGFEMLHRRIISQGDLELLLRSRDIPSFWRKGLIQLSYNPYTRVDVRRMYAAGVLSEEDVYSNYLDLGYSEDRALKLTEWTIIQYGESSRDLTKGEVLGSYKDSVITYAEADVMLTTLGYSQEEIGILIARVDLQKQRAYEKEFVENVRVAYVGKAIERNDVISRLNSLNPPSGFVDERLSLWDLQRERDIAFPSKTDLKGFYQKGIIDEQTLQTQLYRLGYQKQTVEWYVLLWQVTEE